MSQAPNNTPSLPVGQHADPFTTVAAWPRPLASIPDPMMYPVVGLGILIKRASLATDFGTYSAFVNRALCSSASDDAQVRRERDCLSEMRAYEHLREATECFVHWSSAGCLPNDPAAKTDTNATSAPPACQDRKLPAPTDFNAEWVNGPFGTSLSMEELRGLVMRVGVPSDGTWPSMLPFIRAIRQNVGAVGVKGAVEADPTCSGLLRCRLACPLFLELIWSYWMEQAMLVQAIAVIAHRFQNRRLGAEDRLVRLELSHLRPITNLIWGYIQDEPQRLRVARRALEYLHAYGLSLSGKAVPSVQPSEVRPRFLEAFHGLLREADHYFRQQANTMYVPDAFRVLNSLKEVHLILAEGMDNQYGSLPFVARCEMLVQQYLLARPEMQPFLGGRPGVPYAQAWMPHLDAVRQLMGWEDASVRYYHDLATIGEQLLLSVRFWHWSAENDAQTAAAWLTFWRSEIRAYVHAYRTVTGVDLSSESGGGAAEANFATQPGDLIVRRRATAAPARF